jgi:hypothetical protein
MELLGMAVQSREPNAHCSASTRRSILAMAMRHGMSYAIPTRIDRVHPDSDTHRHRDLAFTRVPVPLASLDSFPALQYVNFDTHTRTGAGAREARIEKTINGNQWLAFA